MVNRLGELSMERTPVPLVTFCSTIDPEIGARMDTRGEGLFRSAPNTAMCCWAVRTSTCAFCSEFRAASRSCWAMAPFVVKILRARQLLPGKSLVGLRLLIVGKCLGNVWAVDDQQNLAFGHFITQLGADFHGAPPGERKHRNGARHIRSDRPRHLEFILHRALFHRGEEKLLGMIDLHRSIAVDFLHLHVSRPGPSRLAVVWRLQPARKMRGMSRAARRGGNCSRRFSMKSSPRVYPRRPPGVVMNIAFCRSPVL